jgi:hypothetical protein
VKEAVTNGNVLSRRGYGSRQRGYNSVNACGSTLGQEERSGKEFCRGRSRNALVL